MAAEDYEIVTDRLSEEDGGGWIATVQELPGCMSDGETENEARRNALDAIRAWLVTAERLGRRVAQPRRVRA